MQKCFCRFTLFGNNEEETELTDDGIGNDGPDFLKLLKFDLSFLDFFTDILFCFLLYQKWEDEDKNIFIILCVMAIALLGFSWINQLVCYYN